MGKMVKSPGIGANPQAEYFFMFPEISLIHCIMYNHTGTHHTHRHTSHTHKDSRGIQYIQ